MKKIVYLILIIIFVVGCSSNIVKDKNAKPDWIDNPKAKYPEGMYLAAVGYGSSRRAAEADAMGSVARIFKTDVKANSQYSERWSELESTKQEDEVTLFSENTKDIFISAEQDLINIEIGETYTDDLGRVFALAYIHRSRTADIYDEKITQTDEMVTYYLNKYEETRDKYRKYSYLGVASIFAYQNQNLLNQLAIISPNEYDMVGVRDRLPEITTKMRDIASQISFSIKIDSDQDDIITNTIKEIINEMNFNIIKENAALQIAGSFSYQDVDLGRSAEFVRYEFNLSINDNSNNTVLSINEKGRSGGISRSEAIAKSKSTIVNELKKKLQMRIEKYFDSLAQ